MPDNSCSSPVIVNNKKKTSYSLEKIPISGQHSDFNERFIQDIAFKHPECLPINEIDRVYENLIPVCCELNTPAGPLDILYITPKGRLVIAEAKLWRNPEARRKVIAQIIDYAKELSKWDYESLQKEVSRATKKSGNVLFDLVKSKFDINEAEFVDEVTRSLKRGRFLLLIIGDGIREGVGAIAEFLQNSGNLEFTFGLVELALYKLANDEILIQPRVITKTIIIPRNIIILNNGELQIEETANEIENDFRELSELEKFYLKFWPELLNKLKLDDISQPLPRTVGKRGNITFPMPIPNSSWITVYFLQNKNNVGVFLTFTRGSLGDLIYESLLREKDIITKELDIDAEWSSKDGKHMICSYLHYDNVRDQRHREEIINFLATAINKYVNTFRPRIERIKKEIQ